MIDTTELRRLRDAMNEPGRLEVVVSQRDQDGGEDYCWLRETEYKDFHVCPDGMFPPTAHLAAFAFNNAHAIADELDALRAKVDGYEAAFTDQHNKISALRKYVAELEAALRTIQHHRSPEKDYCREIVEMAEKALEVTNGD